MTHLFVYGTLRPGEVRWQFLEPFVVDDGGDDAVGGELFDTGLGYPAAIFARAPDGAGLADADRTIIRGRSYELREDTLQQALHDLDVVEGAVRGLYHRVEVTTTNGHRAWAYQFGSDPDVQLTRIDGGDWRERLRTD
ncbi:MAG TPA: gamma-glutamylcyclotransferase family protein [Ilumatobacteraceae bacterium]